MEKVIKWKKVNIIFLFILSTLVLNTLGVSDTAAKVKLNKGKMMIYVGNTLQLKMLGTKKKIKWSSNKKKIATVTKKGKVKGVKAGQAVIIAGIGGKKYSCKVTVKNRTINKTSAELKVGNKVNLKILGNKETVKWYSDDNSIAKVNKNGVVTAVGHGVTIINAKSAKKLYCCIVVVKDDNMTARPTEKATVVPKITEHTVEISEMPQNPVSATPIASTSVLENTIQPTKSVYPAKTIVPTIIFATKAPMETIVPTETDSAIETTVPTYTIFPIETMPADSAISTNPYLIKTTYVSREENIGQINFILPENWTNQTKNENSVYHAYFPEKQDKETIVSGVLVGSWEKGGLTEESLEQFIYNKADVEMEKMKAAGLKDISVNISSSKMESGDAVISFWKFSFNNEIQTMLVYDTVIDDYLVEIEIGDVKDNVEPNVYDVGSNIINSLRVTER